jgi:hypothetical protein
MIMSVEQSVKCLARETEVLRDNLPQCLFVHNKSQHGLTWTRTLAVVVHIMIREQYIGSNVETCGSKLEVP